MNKEEITHSQSDEEKETFTEEKETFTEEETKEIKKIITRTMEKTRDIIIAELGTCVTVASTTYVVTNVTLWVIKKIFFY